MDDYCQECGCTDTICHCENHGGEPCGPVDVDEPPSVYQQVQADLADDIATRGLDHWEGQHDDD